jgi:hypothetical protein
VPRILGLIAALLVCVGLLGNGAATAADDPTFAGAPAVDSCFAFTAEQMGQASLELAPVDCGTTHTSQVIGVSTLPVPIDGSATDETMAALSDDCWRSFTKGLGPDLRKLYRSQYSIAYFIPTAAQLASGARWYSCHAIVLEDDRLGALPSPLPTLSRKLPDSVATCLTTKYAFTTCADTHAWRSSYAFYARGKANQRTARAVAERVCPKKVTTRAWYATWQDLPGATFIVGCYSRTKR